MKPQSKGRPANNIDQSLGLSQHVAAASSCYDFTKISEALILAHNSFNNEAVDHCSDSIVMQNKSAPCAYDFRKMSETLSNCEDEDRQSLAFRQSLIIKLGRQAFLRTKVIKREPLKVKKLQANLANVKAWRLPMMSNLTLRSMRKCT